MASRVLIAASVKPLVLSILADGEAYGYQIIQRIQRLSDGAITWSASTLYPVLHRLEAQKLIRSEWRKADTGRERKYYRLTPKGARVLAKERTQWLEVHGVLAQLWQLDVHPE